MYYKKKRYHYLTCAGISLTLNCHFCIFEHTLYRCCTAPTENTHDTVVLYYTRRTMCLCSFKDVSFRFCLCTFVGVCLSCWALALDVTDDTLWMIQSFEFLILAATCASSVNTQQVRNVYKASGCHSASALIVFNSPGVWFVTNKRKISAFSIHQGAECGKSVRHAP